MNFGEQWFEPRNNWIYNVMKKQVRNQFIAGGGFVVIHFFMWLSLLFPQ